MAELTYNDVGKILLDLWYRYPELKRPMIPRIEAKSSKKDAAELEAYVEANRMHNAKTTKIIQETLAQHTDPRTGKTWDISMFVDYDALKPEAQRYRADCDAYNALRQWNGACAID